MKTLNIFYTLFSRFFNLASVEWINECGGWDFPREPLEANLLRNPFLNPRTPKGQGSKPCAVDLAWQPPHHVAVSLFDFMKFPIIPVDGNVLRWDCVLTCLITCSWLFSSFANRFDDGSAKDCL